MDTKNKQILTLDLDMYNTMCCLFDSKIRLGRQEAQIDRKAGSSYSAPTNHSKLTVAMAYQ
jgi:hypothetical protein